MSDTPAGMLPGDQFTFEEWKEAQGKPVSLPEKLPDTVILALEDLMEACEFHSLPLIAIMGNHVYSELGRHPANVSLGMLLARSSVVEEPKHKMQLMAYSITQVDFSKIKL